MYINAYISSTYINTRYLQIMMMMMRRIVLDDLVDDDDMLILSDTNNGVLSSWPLFHIIWGFVTQKFQYKFPRNLLYLLSPSAAACDGYF